MRERARAPPPVLARDSVQGHRLVRDRLCQIVEQRRREKRHLDDRQLEERDQERHDKRHQKRDEDRDEGRQQRYRLEVERVASVSRYLRNGSARSGRFNAKYTSAFRKPSLFPVSWRPP